MRVHSEFSLVENCVLLLYHTHRETYPTPHVLEQNVFADLF